MSVECVSKIVYGWIIENEEVSAYKERCYEKGYDVSDYFICINGYSYETDYIYGILVFTTDYVLNLLNPIC